MGKSSKLQTPSFRETSSLKLQESPAWLARLTFGILELDAGRVQEAQTSLINTPYRGVGRGLCLLTLSKGFHRVANWFRAFLNSSWSLMLPWSLKLEFGSFDRFCPKLIGS